MATVASPPTEQRVVLHNIAWETYESLLADHVSRSAPRFTYDRGELEILGPSTEHERDNRTLAQFVEMVAMELSVNFDNVGSMTFKREDLQQGFEPDSSFYIQNELHIRGKSQIDLMIDPPPDLVIEIEITRQAIPKLPLYASMGVPEIWRSDRGQVAILRLQESSYSESIHSAALPPITSEILTRFLAASRSLTRIEWLRQVREWAAGVR
jgi:Uma2 family endonuclease